MRRWLFTLVLLVTPAACRLDVTATRRDGGRVDLAGSGGASPDAGTAGSGGTLPDAGTAGSGGALPDAGTAGSGGAPGATFKTFIYVGDGTDDRPITGIGFRPDLVLLHAAANLDGCLRTSSMSGDLTKPYNYQAAANLIQSLDQDGFTVGSDNRVNQAGATYVGAAWLGGAGRLAVGTYIGTGTSQSFATPGFLPAAVFVIPEDVNTVSYRLDTMTDTYGLSNGANWPVNITSLDASGFTVGTAGMTNLPGSRYHYAAFAASNPALATGSYVGDGLDARVFGGLGVAPGLALVQIETSSAYPPQLRIDSMAPDTSFELGPFWRTNMIQELLAEGFQLGSDAYVNAAGKTGRWLVYGR